MASHEPLVFLGLSRIGRSTLYFRYGCPWTYKASLLRAVLVRFRRDLPVTRQQVVEIYAKELAANGVDITQIDNFISVAEVNKRVNNLIENRGFRVDLGDGFEKGKKVDFIGVVPLNVVDRNGGFELDSGATKYLNMQYVLPKD